MHLAWWEWSQGSAAEGFDDRGCDPSNVPLNASPTLFVGFRRSAVGVRERKIGLAWLRPFTQHVAARRIGAEPPQRLEVRALHGEHEVGGGEPFPRGAPRA